MIRRFQVILLLALVLCLVWAFIKDSRSSWRHYFQRENLGNYAHELYLPVQLVASSGNIDRCPTCHRGVLGLNDAPHKDHPLFKTHPRIPGHSDMTILGCTPCHGGQGRRLSLEAHQPTLGGGPDPFLSKPFRSARCARCHIPTDLPSNLPGAEVLAQGLQEYLRSGCNGCHEPGRFEPGLGPDLRHLGRRTEAELRQAILDPEKGHEKAIMWSLRWKYDEKTALGQNKLYALITALLALSDNPLPYRNSWVNPRMTVQVECTECHTQEKSGKAEGMPHRCSLLKNNQSLKCSGCHGKSSEQTSWKARASSKNCPQVKAARPLCGICHVRDFVVDKDPG